MMIFPQFHPFDHVTLPTDPIPSITLLPKIFIDSLVVSVFGITNIFVIYPPMAFLSKEATPFLLSVNLPPYRNVNAVRKLKSIRNISIKFMSILFLVIAHLSAVSNTASSWLIAPLVITGVTV